MRSVDEQSARKQMRRVKSVHFVGVGGVGMGGIAEVVLHLGYEVSGSDLNRNLMVKRLEQQGVAIYQSHCEKHVQGVDVVVISSAIPADNPEVMEARRLRIPVVQRAEMLAELMRFSQGIAVAGTHGKTTTTSLVASILCAGGLDPTYVIGGQLTSSKTNAYLGESDWIVVEADESDESFLFLQPMISIVTNIDADHLATYEGDFNRLKQTFVEFIHHLPFYGLAVLCVDDKHVESILGDIARPYVTYGFSDSADVQAINVIQNGWKTTFDVRLKDGGEINNITLNLPGNHNVLNALAAIAVAVEINVKPEMIMKALDRFQGIGRRVEYHGSFNVNGKEVVLIDDYAHHPTELAATIQAVKEAFKDKKLIVIFQPHRFSRTRDLFEDFTAVLCEANVLLLTEVYAAGETPIPGADGRSLSRSIRSRAMVDPIFVENIDDVAETLLSIVSGDEVVLTLGAGSVGALAGSLADLFKKEFSDA